MSNRMLVNIRGCNGSGKSTIPMSMMDDPDMYVVEKPYQGKVKKILTVFPSYGWVALGTYFNKTGGLDCFPNNELTIKTLWYALKRFPEYHILMEGVISSTVFSTYAQLFSQVQERYPERQVIIVSLLPPLDTCLERIQQRNGGKSIKEEQVASKWHTVARNADKFAEAGILSLKWDNSQVWPKYAHKPMIKVMMRFIRKELNQ